jgi:hypothetical protein
MEVAHADLAKVARMVFVEIDAMVMLQEASVECSLWAHLSAGIASTARMFAMFADTAVTVRNVSAKLARFLLRCRHFEHTLTKRDVDYPIK